MFGKLTLDAIPYHEPIIMGTLGVVILGGLALLGAITYIGKWSYLWKEWITSVDHKRIGVMYIILALVMLLRESSRQWRLATTLATCRRITTTRSSPRTA